MKNQCRYLEGNGVPAGYTVGMGAAVQIAQGKQE